MQPADAFLGDLTTMARTLVAGAVAPLPKQRRAKLTAKKNLPRKVSAKKALPKTVLPKKSRLTKPGDRR
jgi:hypothetical protein